MELRQLEYVVAAADAGTFTAAAAAVHVTQPTLSQGIAALERELGVELFHRVGRRAVLSAAGEAFLAPARQALRDAAAARTTAAAFVGLESGRLDLASLPTLTVDLLVPWIGAFRAAHPGVQVVVTEPEGAEAPARAVLEGRCEVALAELPVPSGLRVVTRRTQRIVAVTRRRGDVGPGAVTLRRLSRLPLVTTPAGTSTRRLVDDAFRRAGASPAVVVETASREALVPLVLAGAGITFLPEPLARDAARRGAHVVALRPALQRDVGLVHRTGTLSPAAAAFVALAATHPPD